MFANFFIDRPIFAWVIAILITFAGALALRALPVSQYPSVAPPALDISVAYPGASLVPGMIVGGTDARFYRDKGAIAYGTGLFSPDVTLEKFGSRFHGNDERIDVESLRLTTNLWLDVVRDLLG